jgi:UPF0755 protein
MGRFLLVVFLGILILSLLSGGFAFYLYASGRARLFDGDPRAQGSEVFTVRSGETINQVLARLEAKSILRKGKILSDRTLINLYREWKDEPIRLKAGTVRLERSASLVSLLEILQAGGIREFTLTIPEGKTIAEVAELARRKQPDFHAEKFTGLTRDPDFVRQIGIDEGTLEGYLFPSTYDFPPGTTPEQLIESMVQGFRRTVSEVTRSTANTSGRPMREIVIIASLIEKEARRDEDRPLIASVIENRMNRSMRLQIDATVNFALGHWRRLTYADYKFESTYNTYLHDGLPPGPICSPGRASLRAALDPAETDFLFYVHKGDGHHAFAVTYEEHLANVRAYIKNDPEALRVVEEQAATAGARTVAPPVITPAAPDPIPSNTAGEPPNPRPMTGEIAPKPGDPGSDPAAPASPRQY